MSNNYPSDMKFQTIALLKGLMNKRRKSRTKDSLQRLQINGQVAPPRVVLVFQKVTQDCEILRYGFRMLDIFDAMKTCLEVSFHLLVGFVQPRDVSRTRDCKRVTQREIHRVVQDRVKRTRALELRSVPSRFHQAGS